MVVVAIVLLAGGFRWRVSAIEARNRELEIQVQRTTQFRQMQAERDRILELSQDMICIAGMDGYFKYLNPAWEKTLGYTDEELMSRPFLDFIHPDDRANTTREVASLAAGRHTVNFENRYTHKDGSIRHFSWMVTPFPDEERMYAVARDITEHKQAERELQNYQLRLKTLATQLTITEEKERRTIAADLHDHVGQWLALARMQLDDILETNSEKEKNNLVKAISDTLLSALGKTRSLIFELSSPALNELGLSAATSEWLDEQIAKKHGLQTEFVDNISTKYRNALDDSVWALLFRNLRELLTNVVKHAQANKVWVHFEEETNGLKIIVEDDGVGFDLEAIDKLAEKTRHYGLFSIRERMADLGGSLEIETSPGEGCRVALNVPLEKGIELG